MLVSWSKQRFKIKLRWNCYKGLTLRWTLSQDLTIKFVTLEMQVNYGLKQWWSQVYMSYTVRIVM